MKHLVLITSDARPKDHGTGFVVRRAGQDGALAAQVVTAAHVVLALGAEQLRVAGHRATLVVDLSDRGIDLAVLQVAGLEGVDVLVAGPGHDSDPIEVQGFAPPTSRPVATKARGVLVEQTVTAHRGINRPAWRIELDTALVGGHSGGPVLSATTGRVVGVITDGPRAGVPTTATTFIRTTSRRPSALMKFMARSPRALSGRPATSASRSR